MLRSFNHFFQQRKDYGILFLRLVIAWRLVAGTWPFVAQQKSMTVITDYFDSLHLPAPAIAAVLSVYAQFVCGVLYALGLWVRPAAVVMIINFAVAIIAAHIHDPIANSFPAWAILAASVVFLFAGAGPLSLTPNSGRQVTHSK